MNSKKNGSENVPHGWIICSSKSNPGKKYYFNKKTGKSSWTCPKSDNVQAPSKKKKDKVSSNAKSKELANKNLKRKSSSSTEDPTAKKKNKTETPVPKSVTIGNNSHIKKTSTQGNTQNAQSSNKKTTSPVKPPRLRTSSNSSNISPYNDVNTIKNLANNRLSQLRTRLSAEAQNEDINEPQRKRSCSSTETSEYCRNKDSNCTVTSESPISETLPHSSQFLTVNKILSSIKAQLPERYNNGVKPKDTFADIEERICNQVAEYTTKHPATPPQFTEASKIVSAIKSKLCKTPNVVRDGEDVKTYKSANDRLNSLRANLSCKATELDTSIDNNMKITDSCEAMEVEYTEKSSPTVTQVQISENIQSNVDNSNKSLVLVVDTNIFIHQLDCIRNVLNSHVKGYKEQPTLLVPWRVINELDRLKDNNNGNGAICKRAKAAMDYLYKSLPENTSIKGQSLRDANSHIYPCEIPDDEILNCCLQQLERGKAVILLSHDKNLCNKAIINQVECMDVEKLKGMLESKIQPTSDPELYASVKHYQSAMYSLLANILENEMRAKYNELWLHVLFKAPPWTLTDVLQCLLKHWIAVFNEVFPRIEHLIADLKNSLVFLENKEPRSLTQSEVSNFLELCLDVAKKCQIIPEYMELAKLTVDRLQRKSENESADMAERDGETTVIEAFEKLWNVFSGYCAKLSSGLGVPHDIEDKLPCNDTLDALLSKWSIFSSQIRSFAQAIRSVSDTNDHSASLEDKLRHLESVFKDSLALICVDNAGVNKDNIKVFYLKCRNMFQEASAKFSQLTELLSVCEDKIN